MGVSVRISSCHLSSLSLSLSLNPTVTMLFLPRLTLLLFIAFLGFCCLTQVKADDRPSCKSVEAQCKHVKDGITQECKHDGNTMEAKYWKDKKCYHVCYHGYSIGINCKRPDGGW